MDVYHDAIAGNHYNSILSIYHLFYLSTYTTIITQTSVSNFFLFRSSQKPPTLTPPNQSHFIKHHTCNFSPIKFTMDCLGTAPTLTPSPLTIVQIGLQIYQKLFKKSHFQFTHPLITPDGYSHFHLESQTSAVFGVEPDAVGRVLLSLFKRQFGLGKEQLVMDAYECQDIAELAGVGGTIAPTSYILDFKSGDSNANLHQAQLVVGPDHEDGLVNIVVFKLKVDFQLADQLAVETKGYSSGFRSKSSQRIVRTATALKSEDIERLNGAVLQQALIGVSTDLLP